MAGSLDRKTKPRKKEPVEYSESDDQDIFDRTTRLEERVKSIATDHNDLEYALSIFCEATRKTLYGDGDGNTGGMTSDINILKKGMATIEKLLWAIFVLGLGLIGTTVYNIIIEHAAVAAAAAPR